MVNCKKVLITGVSNGIGESITKQLLDLNVEVVGISRTQPKFINHEKFTYYPIDLSEKKKLNGHLKNLQKKEPDIDSLILNAGIGYFKHLEEFSEEEIFNMMDLNFIAPALITKTFIPQFKTSQKGNIIFIGSEASLEGNPKGSLYSASKFALRGFSQSIRKECKNLTGK